MTPVEYPAPETSHAQPDANGADIRSVSDGTETQEAIALTFSMIEAILRLNAGYPGLVEKIAHAVPHQPGQSYLDNLNTLMAAISDEARFRSGLGLAASETLKPFEKFGKWSA